jgi:hypothetical protein
LNLKPLTCRLPFALCLLTLRARERDRGVALVAALLATLVLAAFGSALVLISVTETGISAYHERATGTFYAADAALERAIADLFALADWNVALSGLATSTLTDGPPSGVRLVWGTEVDIDALSSDLRCGRREGCGDADMDAFTAERPWGIDNPRWQLYAWGPLSRMTPVSADHDAYVLVWIADDAGDTDGNPLVDGSADDNPGRGIVQLTAHAYGAGGSRRVLEATVARRVQDDGQEPNPGVAPRVIVWREVR